MIESMLRDACRPRHSRPRAAAATCDRRNIKRGEVDGPDETVLRINDVQSAGGGVKGDTLRIAEAGIGADAVGTAGLGRGIASDIGHIRRCNIYRLDIRTGNIGDEESTEASRVECDVHSVAEGCHALANADSISAQVVASEGRNTVGEARAVPR